MTEVGTKAPDTSWLWAIGAARHDPAARLQNVDLLAILIAILLPWSTSGVGIAIVLWVVALIPTIEPRALWWSLGRPASWLPIAFFVLALAGMLWSDGAWFEREQALTPTAKFLLLPLLIYHFGRTDRGVKVFIAFLFSCVALAKEELQDAQLHSYTAPRALS